MKLKRIVIGTVVAALIFGGGYLALAGGTGTSNAAQKTIQTNSAKTAAKANEAVIADAKVVPVKSAVLSFSSGGVLSRVLVAEGDRVEAGQVIAQLEAAHLKAAANKAEAEMGSAEARLNELKNGPRPQEIEAARASVSAAEAQLAKETAGARPEDVAAAEATLRAAQASLEKVKRGPDETRLIAAKADVANAVATLRQAQSKYDKVSWQSDIGIRPEALQLEQATNSYAAAKARLDELMKEPDQEAVANAAAQVQRAEAELNKLKGEARPVDLAVAQAEIRRAQAQLELLQAGARGEAMAASEADLASMKAALEQSRAVIAETELRAPFAGTIIALDASAGEYVAAGAVIARLADTSEWQIETQDLTELNVPRLHQGDPVTVKFDAIPELTLNGKISRINEYGKNKQGDIVYSVYVKPDQQDERLRWNMTAEVSIK